MIEAPAPVGEYERRAGACAREVTDLEKRTRAISNARLAVFAAGAVALWLGFGTRTAPAWTPLPALAAFVALAVAHDRLLRRLDRTRRAAAYYERGLARMRDDWAGTGDPGDDLRPDGHDYADDLDLFGTGSVFELISTARTSLGRERLAAWLCAPSPTDTLPRRQAAVRALALALDLREDLASLGEDVADRLDRDALVAWARERAHVPDARLRIGLALLSSFSIALLAAGVLGASFAPAGLALVVQVGVAFGLRARVATATRGMDGATRALGLPATLLERLEGEHFEDPGLADLHRCLVSGEHAASVEIRRLRRLTDLRDATRNQFFAPIGALLLWGTQCALAAEAWRARCGGEVEHWLDALAELEALASLGAYHAEHPGDPFPEWADDDEGPLFDARGLAHPLLPADRSVRNDLRLGRDEPIAIVSGSNMSGKSTLLRSVGVAVVLGQAGAPVRAHALRLSAVAIGASLRIVDSLQTGTSHFYAELVRLRRISELARDPDGPPLLFLLDEVLHGTNSHDRRIGAEAVVRDLLARGALGLVTTHDLALARIGDELAPRVRNVHFEDRLEQGRLRFDYRLRPGVVERSNALDLMREVGLDV